MICTESVKKLFFYGVPFLQSVGLETCRCVSRDVA